ncbi:MAG: N-glycosylase/DNA lyase [Nitrospirota bacterium]
MELNKPAISQLKKIYRIKKKEIVSRLKEFKKLWIDGNDEEIFVELAFCILTPQSRAKPCWDAIVKLKEQDLLLKGNTGQIKQRLNYVRFRNKKAEYIVKARKLFMTQNRIKVIPPHPPLVKGGWGDFKVNNYVFIKPILSKFVDIYECREWLVNNIDGFGYKEASHFLRNIGLGEKIAILDRHILRNLKEIGIIEEIPKSISRTKYIQIEKNMKEFAMQIDIPLSHLDLLLWYKETGEIFK